MKAFSFSFFILGFWLAVLTFSYFKLKDNYNKSNAEVQQLRETVKVYKQDLERFVEIYADNTSKELAEYKDETNHTLLVHEQMYEATIKGLMGDWK